MSGRRLIARTGLAMLAGMIVFLLFSVVESQATPIRPDLQKLIKQSEQER